MVRYSVVVPVYNSEKTLSRCLKSLVSQDRKDVQVVVVNDGSTDNSEKIVLDFAEKYPSIEYIYQKNAGVSCARNSGLEHVKGTYVTFLDSDDYVADDYFAVLDQAGDCDLLVFAHENVGGVPLDEAMLFSELQQLDSTEKRLELLLASRKIMSPVNKRFKKSLIEAHKLRFLPDMHTGEDFNFCMAYAVHCDMITTLAKKIIFVDISDQNSLSRRYRSQLDKKLRVVFDQVAYTICTSSLCLQQKNQLLAVSDYLFAKHVFSCIAEEFKKKRLHYFRDRNQVADICRTFRQPVSTTCCGFLHKGIRLLLQFQIYWPFYMVAYLLKGRKYANQ